ncbi:bifunctional hydroxymethylpyrimidine kinase/phosphomethylpyrimidine kinase [Thioflexithrix psekupsensis]|uniref:hydroxymethylpyrimidine kinase n=1 Tax=Thioflexithrix psekupsensis TaxID=1570016 RepID=A0A251X7P0_9GAMM|nr:bifunctional hydroxymethylpyrimidine kinase/phosphomethylpyrimidine kinase [Thioflexithrix psekupsensis]OUD14016.1 bifunctional hydroxymethylpyrimidine kinase/phosphomethylpyrimidine kinase [Thioflexithrix psekupsensis]
MNYKKKKKKIAITNILTIAGSDPSGGAGIQADLKTFSAFGAYGMAAITGLTAQNTQTVTAVHYPPAEFLQTQLDTLIADVRIDAIKIGMLGTVENIHVVKTFLQNHAFKHVVLDTVMISKTGSPLLDQNAVNALRELALFATVLTPNLPEAAVLCEKPIPNTIDAMYEFMPELKQLGAKNVLLKGGHLTQDSLAIDLFGDSQGLVIPISADRVQGIARHGTGCTLSAAIAAVLPHCATPFEAVQHAKIYVSEAIENSNVLQVGSGHPPVHHFYALWE